MAIRSVLAKRQNRFRHIIIQFKPTRPTSFPRIARRISLHVANLPGASSRSRVNIEFSEEDRARISRFILLAYSSTSSLSMAIIGLRAILWNHLCITTDNTPAHLPYNKARCILRAETIPRRWIIVMGDLTCLHRIFSWCDSSETITCLWITSEDDTCLNISLSPRITDYRQPNICHCSSSLSPKDVWLFALGALFKITTNILFAKWSGISAVIVPIIILINYYSKRST